MVLADSLCALLYVCIKGFIHAEKPNIEHAENLQGSFEVSARG
jgi:hypothetical protein